MSRPSIDEIRARVRWLDNSNGERSVQWMLACLAAISNAPEYQEAVAVELLERIQTAPRDPKWGRSAVSSPYYQVDSPWHAQTKDYVAPDRSEPKSVRVIVSRTDGKALMDPIGGES